MSRTSGAHGTHHTRDERAGEPPALPAGAFHARRARDSDADATCKPSYDGDLMSESSNFKSELKTGAERFLARTMVHALNEGWRSADDFLRHFKPNDLMLSLEKATELRAKILVQAAGVHERIAKKKSTSSAAEDLRIALDEGVTTPKAILDLLPADDRVRYLDRTKIWAFITEDQFWAPNSSSAGERAVERMTFLLETSLSESLISLQDLADGVTFETISTRLPLKELQRVVRHALDAGRNKMPLTEQGLLEVVPLKSLVGYIPLEHVYKRVILAKVAQPAAFVAGGTPNEDAWPEDEGGGEDKGKSRGEKKAEAKKVEEKKVEEKKPEPAAEAEPKSEASPDLVDEAELMEVEMASVRPPAEEEARRKVVDRLTTIQRLPPRHAELSTPILLSIESMYADLLAASTDEAREMCIRDSFPNESHLTMALLALIELLDPSIDVKDPVIRDADADSLIKVVLFEERRRYEQAHPSARPPGGPNSGGARRSAPPPLPEKRVR
jgi:hypothetical protein